MNATPRVSIPARLVGLVQRSFFRLSLALSILGFIFGVLLALQLSPVKAEGGCEVDETIDMGTEGQDELFGSNFELDTMRGLGERDKITGGACGDDIQGNEGGDFVAGNEGADDVEGNKGSDNPNTCGVHGCAQVRGGPGADIPQGGPHKDKVTDNTEGNDFDDLHGGSEDDKVFADDGDGADSVTGGAGSDDCESDSGDVEFECEQ